MADNYITQEFTLPSKGLLNPDIPEGKIVQRCMMVSDQKFLASSKVENKMTEMIKRTTVSPENIDVGALTITDSLFMLFKLRILSYGDIYKYRTVCPECGQKIDVELNLAELESVELDKDYEKSLRVKLPRKEDTVVTRLITNNISDNISKEIRRARQKNKEGIDEFVIRLSAQVSSIILQKPDKDGNKEITDIFDIRDYLSTLTDFDATAIESVLSSVEYGIVPTVPYTCNECGNEVELDIVFDTEFFRPKFNRGLPHNNR